MPRLELPNGWKRAKLEPGTALRYSASGESVAATVLDGRRASSGVWRASGELVHFSEGYAALAWKHDDSGLLRATSDGHIRLEFLAWPSLTTEAALQLAYPSAGVGGLVLSVSKSSRYAALLIYSGQSEESYELFAVGKELRHLGGMKYRFGESGTEPMAFSPDEKHVALALNERTCWWSTDDDFDTPAEGGSVEWAALYVHRLGKEHPRRYALVVYVPRGWIPDDEVAERSWPSGLKFTGPKTLELSLPWGGTAELRLGQSATLQLPPIVG